MNSNKKRVSCLVKFPFDAKHHDQVSLRVGDTVKEVEQLPGGWWRGENKGKLGMFPDQCVTVIDDNHRSNTVQGKCKALFSYQPTNSDELTLNVGDVIDVLGEVEEGWWQGRRKGVVGVFPSNFVVLLDQTPVSTFEPAPALPPKPTKELCRALFPYTAVNDDELSLSEGDIVTIISKDAPDKGWWRGELYGNIGLFPDNFVQLLPPVTHDEEKKSAGTKTSSSLYPTINKYIEKITSTKEFATRISSKKDNAVIKQETNKEVIETHIEGQQMKKPPVPAKKSPTLTTKNKMVSTVENKDESSSTRSVSICGDTDNTDGLTGSKLAHGHETFDRVERNSILNDPRAQRAKAPRRRPPSQALRDETIQQVMISNGHEVPTQMPSTLITTAEKSVEIKPKTREWEKHRAPWMEELKLNQAKKTQHIGDVKVKTVDKENLGGSDDRLAEIGSEKGPPTVVADMSKSTSSVVNRVAVAESPYEENKHRNSLDSSKGSHKLQRNSLSPSSPGSGRTIKDLLDNTYKRSPSPPTSIETKSAVTRTCDTSDTSFSETSNLHKGKIEKTIIEQKKETSISNDGFEHTLSTETRTNIVKSLDNGKNDVGPSESSDVVIAQLNNRITFLEKHLEVQLSMFTSAIDDLQSKLSNETQRRRHLESELEKLANCVTQME